MRRYETITIIDPDLSDEGREEVFGRIKDVIHAQGGALIEFDEWGSRRLAYEIRKKQRGYYLRMDYCGTGALVAELERSFRIDDRVMKYMTVLLDENVDMEKVQAEIDRAQAKQEATGSDEKASSGEQTPSDEDHPAEAAPGEPTDSEVQVTETQPSDDHGEEK
jgi:small subunit ribosomal protein S6